MKHKLLVIFPERATTRDCPYNTSSHHPVGGVGAILYGCPYCKISKKSKQ